MFRTAFNTNKIDEGNMVIEFTLSLLLSLGVPFAVEEQYCYEKIIMVDNIKDFGVVSWASVLKHTFTFKECI